MMNIFSLTAMAISYSVTVDRINEFKNIYLIEYLPFACGKMRYHDVDEVEVTTCKHNSEMITYRLNDVLSYA